MEGIKGLREVGMNYKDLKDFGVLIKKGHDLR